MPATFVRTKRVGQIFAVLALCALMGGVRGATPPLQLRGGQASAADASGDAGLAAIRAAAGRSSLARTGRVADLWVSVPVLCALALGLAVTFTLSSLTHLFLCA